MTDTAEPMSFPPTYVITLVHGTILFGIIGKDPKWIKEGSDLRQTLTKTLPGSVLFPPFSWSGGNSAGSRQIASKQLRATLTRQLKDYPDARHYVIAHSHGGNVTMYALRDSKLKSQIDGVVCLSTPFLHVNKRNLGSSDDEKNVARSILLTLLLGIVLFASSRVTLVIPGYTIYFLLFCLVFFPGLLVHLLYPYLERMAGELVETMKLDKIVDKKKLLIIRTAGDEATLGLGMSQFASWFAGKWTHGVVLFRKLLQVIPFAWLVDIPAAIPALFGVPSMVLACCAFGCKLGLNSIWLEINAEVAPPGSWFIDYLPPEKLPIIQLSHSSAYDNHEALNHIAQWIVSQQEK
jgi:hypothetical protein